MNTIEKLNDEDLFKLCQQYGTQARLWRQKFAGLLPEVFKRKLYFKKGFSSIFEFAKKLAGMSEEQVRVVLNLEKRFEDKPVLKELLINGEVSVNKLVRVASIATIDNQELLAEQVKILPQSALETLARDEKYSREKIAIENVSLRAHSNVQQKLENATSVSVLPEVVNKANRDSAFTRDHQKLDLSTEVTEKLFELQQKGIDINALILEFLQKREIEIAQEKEQLAIHAQQNVSRYIPTKIQKIIVKEHGTKCSIPTCRRDAQVIHHTQRFALSRNHDPRFLAPLCKEHHIIAHSIDTKFIANRAKMETIG